MGKGFQGAVLRTLGAREHLLTVTGTTRVAEHFHRVTFHSDTMLDPEGETPATWVRLWFPDPEGGPKMFQRGYTLLDADPATGTFSVEFVIHHPSGPAAHWAENAEVGDTLVGMRFGARPFELLDPPPEGYLLLGDLAAYPAIASIARAVPADIPVVVYLESHSPHDRDIPLVSGPNITVEWVEDLPDGQGLAQAVRGGEWTGWYAWVTAESLTTRRAKTVLQREFEFTRATLHSQAYWVSGRSMGTSRSLDEAGDTPGTPAAATADGASATPAPAAADPARTASTPRPRTGGPGTPDTGAGPATRRKEPGVLRPARGALIAGGIAQGLLSLLQIVPFILFAELARLFLDGADRERFVSTAVAALVVMGLSAFGTAALVFAMHLYDARFAATVRRRLMRKLTTLPLGWFGERQPGDVKKLVADDVQALHYLVTHAVLDLVGAVVTPLATLIYLFAVQWRLGLVLLLPNIAFFGVMVSISRRDADKVVQSQRLVARASGEAQTFISTRDQARVFGPSSVVDLPGTLRRTGDFVEEWQLDTGPAKILAVMINRPTTVLGILVVAAWLLMTPGWLTAADLVPFLVLGTSFGGQLLAVTTNTGALVTGLESRDGLELMLGTPGLAGPADRPAPDGHIRFSGVRFGYGPGHTVLPDLDLRLEAGTVTALVGPSGAGKSTVAALLARLWDPQAGQISIDGRDLRDMTQDELYSTVTILLQDVQLIRATVRENIALTRPDATAAEVEAAARAAHVHDTVAALPQGYDTVVDTDRLSGGERQRIGIARALLADTPVVVLDEATAAADPDSEWAIRQGLSRLLEGRTVLMIAHRLHTVRDADRIVVLDRGRVVESGTHDDLLAADGLYAGLWRATTPAVPTAHPTEETR
ncbi:ATP-binding cassette domain-containing protein [Corynebacterium bovis]|uniref:ABC transporter ATP-binding protein/permease n=1 Tax=Corynebacterium bovis TaxID=36808 RepID=UPI00254DB9A3|nr:ATP-binding cassette domain-containing protein [Corynebacterium bovis]MDK8509895.1 ATP-binding cassette domain-containing protein [Corynebacterium bovis]